MPKTSALSSDYVLNHNTDFFVFVDTLDTTQATSGSTKKVPGSAVDTMVWSLSANYNINKIFPMYTVVNGASANWNAVYTAFALQSPNNASVYTTVNSNSATWGSGGTSAPYNLGAISGITVLNLNNGDFQKMQLTGTTSLSAPLFGTEGDTLKLWITALSANRSLSAYGGIKIPDESLLSWPKTLTSNKKYIVQMQYDGTYWMLQSLVGGYN